MSDPDLNELILLEGGWRQGKRLEESDQSIWGVPGSFCYRYQHGPLQAELPTSLRLKFPFKTFEGIEDEIILSFFGFTIDFFLKEILT